MLYLKSEAFLARQRNHHKTMANPNPKTEQLALGRGKRPKLNNETVGMRLSSATRQNLEKIAESYDCIYGGKPWIAGLLTKIGEGQLIVVPAPPQTPALNQKFDSKQAIKKHLKNKHYSSRSQTEQESTDKKNDSSPTESM